MRRGSLDDDLDALNAGNPFWWGRDFLADRLASSPPEDPWLILVAEIGDQPVGYGFLLAKGIQAGGRAMNDLFVLPHARGRGVGRALLETLAAVTRDHDFPGLLTSMPDDDDSSLATVRAWGCSDVGHHRESVLDLTTLDDAALDAIVARVEAAGISLEPLRADTDDAEWRRVYAMVDPIWEDTPDAEGASDSMPYAVWRGFFPDPAYVLVARRGGEPVAADMLMDRTKDDALNILFIGVSRQARGLGLSAALMARHAQLMRDAGHRRIFTQNMDSNSRILASNDRVGFVVQGGYIDVAYDVGSSSS